VSGTLHWSFFVLSLFFLVLPVGLGGTHKHFTGVEHRLTSSLMTTYVLVTVLPLIVYPLFLLAIPTLARNLAHYAVIFNTHYRTSVQKLLPRTRTPSNLFTAVLIVSGTAENGVWLHELKTSSA
jgi:hypothetical protein